MLRLTFLWTSFVMAGRGITAALAAAALAHTGNVYAIPDGAAATQPLYNVPSSYLMPSQFADREVRASFPLTSEHLPHLVSASYPGAAPLEMPQQPPSEYSYTPPGPQHQQLANPMTPGIIYEQVAFPFLEISSHQTQHNQALVQRARSSEVGRDVPVPSSSEFASWPTVAENTLAQTRQKLPDDKHTRSEGHNGSPKNGEPEKSSQSLGTSLRHTWLFAATRDKLHEAVEFMRNTGGEFQFSAPTDVGSPGYWVDHNAVEVPHGIDTSQISPQKLEQIHPPFVRANETHFLQRGESSKPVPYIPDRMSGSETAMSGSMTVPQDNFYVHANSLTSSTDTWNVPIPNISHPVYKAIEPQQAFVTDNPVASVRGANLAFPLAARAYQFMVPRAELFLASSRYAEEYLDLVAALYCLFQKWPCNSVEEFAVQTKLHQGNAETGSASRPGGETRPS